jgi:hypothetical protein
MKKPKSKSIELNDLLKQIPTKPGAVWLVTEVRATSPSMEAFPRLTEPRRLTLIVDNDGFLVTIAAVECSMPLAAYRDRCREQGRVFFVDGAMEFFQADHPSEIPSAKSAKFGRVFGRKRKP